MELQEVKRDELLVVRSYLIVTYRSDKLQGFNIYDGATIGGNGNYFVDGKDMSGNILTYKFYLLPKLETR